MNFLCVKSPKIRCEISQGFHVLDFFLVLSCNSFNLSTQVASYRAQRSQVRNVAVAAMGGVPSKTNADEEDEYHDEVHDSKAPVFSGEKKDVNKNDLFREFNVTPDLVFDSL